MTAITASPSLVITEQRFSFRKQLKPSCNASILYVFTHLTRIIHFRGDLTDISTTKKYHWCRGGAISREKRRVTLSSTVSTIPVTNSLEVTGHEEQVGCEPNRLSRQQVCTEPASLATCSPRFGVEYTAESLRQRSSDFETRHTIGRSAFPTTQPCQ